MKTAIIGGIGSGKSFALNVAKSMGFETLSADEINAELLEDEDYIKTLSERFPFAVENGVVNKKKLAQVVFSNKIKLAELNAIAHPRILKKIAEREGDAVVELPLFVDGAREVTDRVLLVSSPLFLRFWRLKKYRKMSFEDALMRIKNQPSQKELRACADVIVKNVGKKRFERELKEALYTLAKSK